MKISGVKPLLKKLELRKKRIAAERDKLRDFIEEYEMILESCDEAERELESAADSLSQYV